MRAATTTRPNATFEELRRVQERLDRLARYAHSILALQPLCVSLRLDWTPLYALWRAVIEH
jgi:hypothetical protein